MAGVNAAPITANSVVENIKHVWCVAVDVIAGDSSLRSFGCIVSHFYYRCHQMQRGHFFVVYTNASVYRATGDDRR